MTTGLQWSTGLLRGGAFVFGLSALVLLPRVPEALTPSGKTVTVIQATSASGPGGSRTLAAAKPVYSGDQIKTGGSGEAQIVFADNTRLVVGPNSSIVIDKYVYNAGGSGAQVSMQLARGAFRFISGSGSKQNFRITTPSATLGIRGTAFDVGVGGRIGTGVAVFDGSVRVCSRRTGECAIVNRGCNIAVVSPDGGIGAPRGQADKAAMIRAAFPLIGRQNRYRGEFRVSTRGCGSLSVPPGGVRNINLSPAGGGVINEPPGGGGLSPGASNPTGRSGSSNSNASETATSGTGKERSSRSNAGGKNK
jgi:hypothetical protein